MPKIKTTLRASTSLFEYYIPIGNTSTFYEHPPNDKTFSSCLLWMDDNHHMTEWIAYHHFTLPLRHLVIAVDPHSSTKLHIEPEWYSLMKITVWNDEDFNHQNKSLLRSDYDSANALKSKHRARQSSFYQECSRYLKNQNRTYTTFHDTDEYITISDEFYSKNNRSGVDFSSEEFKSQPGHILKVLDHYNNNQTDVGISSVCFHVPRAKYSAVESDNSLRNHNVPDWINSTHYNTLRYRYRTTPRPGRDGLGKSIIDVSRLTESNIDQGGLIHRPLYAVCPKGTVWMNYGERPFGIHHYLGSWESYSFRDDARKETVKRRDVWEVKANDTTGGPDDEIRPWMQGFVNSMGVRKPRDFCKMLACRE